LKIRRFVIEKDEADWVKLTNAVYYRHPTHALLTAEDYKKFEKDPEWDSKGKFIVEVNNNPVGWVSAHVDKLREDKKGFVWVGMLPKFRGQGIEEELVGTAVRELKRRGMKGAQSVVEEDEDARVWERLGFKLVRRSSLMTKMLDVVKSGIGENTEVTLQPLYKDSDEDLKLLNRFWNESFKEHFNYRPVPLESTVYLVRKDFSWKTQGWFFALLDGQHVGFVGALVGELDNRAENAKRGWVLPRGWILSIGVLKPYRRTGIGTRLILHGMNFLKAQSVAIVMLTVDDSNVTNAKQLYEKVGFTEEWKYSFYEKRIA
jgi:ribosomal protein S18 acetylase RimI-like enzyme